MIQQTSLRELDELVIGSVTKKTVPCSVCGLNGVRGVSGAVYHTLQKDTPGLGHFSAIARRDLTITELVNPCSNERG